MNVKKCTKCKEILSVENFYSSPRYKCGYISHCKKCQIAGKKKRYERDVPKARERSRVTAKKWRELNPDKSREVMRNYKKRNPEKQKDYYRRTKDEKREYGRINADRINARMRERRRTDVAFKFKTNMRTRIWDALNNQKGKKETSLFKYLGCSLQELKDYLSSKFTDGMSWENYGLWQIDHIKPCAKFDLTIKEEQMKCFNYSNLQPLWEYENKAKGDKYETGEYKVL